MVAGIGKSGLVGQKWWQLLPQQVHQVLFTSD
ncbi:Uncharacterised protein [Actinobacillus equuli]|nr:Uncharacterised protein [Actinobacillus equuli]